MLPIEMQNKKTENDVCYKFARTFHGCN